MQASCWVLSVRSELRRRIRFVWANTDSDSLRKTRGKSHTNSRWTTACGTSPSYRSTRRVDVTPAGRPECNRRSCRTRQRAFCFLATRGCRRRCPYRSGPVSSSASAWAVSRASRTPICSSRRATSVGCRRSSSRSSSRTWPRDTSRCGSALAARTTRPRALALRGRTPSASAPC